MPPGGSFSPGVRWGAAMGFDFQHTSLRGTQLLCACKQWAAEHLQKAGVEGPAELAAAIRNRARGTASAEAAVDEAECMELRRLMRRICERAENTDPQARSPWAQFVVNDLAPLVKGARAFRWAVIMDAMRTNSGPRTRGSRKPRSDAGSGGRTHVAAAILQPRHAYALRYPPEGLTWRGVAALAILAAPADFVAHRESKTVEAVAADAEATLKTYAKRAGLSLNAFKKAVAATHASARELTRLCAEMARRDAEMMRALGVQITE